MATWRSSLVIVGAAAAMAAPSFIGGSAKAQTAGGGAADKSGYAAQGIPLGGFRLYPSVKAGMLYDDNILFRQNPQSDFIATISPSVTVNSNWSNHSLILQGSSTHRRYLKYSEQDTDEYSGAANGRLDVDRTLAVNGSISYGHMAEDRGSLGDDAQLSKFSMYNEFSASAGASKQLNRFIVGLNGSISRYRYDPVTTGSLAVNQSFRDRDVDSAGARLDYQLSSVTNFFVSGNANQVNYTQSAIVDRGSSGYSLLGGVKFEITRLLHGEVALGYIRQSFNNPIYPGFTGLNYNANIIYAPTALTTVTFTASRALSDSALIGVPGVLVSDFDFGVSHELLRSLTVTGSLNYENRLYRGVNRSDGVFGIGINARKSINDYLALSMAYNRQQRTSSGSGPGINYRDNKVSLTLIVSK